MEERRVTQRRECTPVTGLPLHTPSGELVTEERRRVPARRLNDIQVEAPGFLDYISRLQ
jgi:hypothetical protein